MRIEQFRTDRAGAAARKRQPAGGEAFTVLAGGGEAAEATPLQHAAAVATPFLPDILPGPAVQDREARRHGSAVLRALGSLQIAALAGQRGEALRALSDLAKERKVAADPGLDQVLRAIAQRAAIELARPE